MAKKASKAKAKKASPKKKSRDVLEVDFSDTQSRKGEKRSGRTKFDEGDYRVKVKGQPTTGKSPEKKTPFIEFVFEFVDGQYKGKTISDRFYLSSGALWRLRNVIEAMGLKVPSSTAKLKLKEYDGKKLGITIENEENDEGKEYSNVTDTFKYELVEDSDDDSEDTDDSDDDDSDDEGSDDDETADSDDDDDSEDSDDDSDDGSDEDSDDDTEDSLDLDDL